jgi:hypothetical protein
LLYNLSALCRFFNFIIPLFFFCLFLDKRNIYQAIYFINFFIFPFLNVRLQILKIFNLWLSSVLNRKFILIKRKSLFLNIIPNIFANVPILYLKVRTFFHPKLVFIIAIIATSKRYFFLIRVAWRAFIIS